MLLQSNPQFTADLVNPDLKDLEVTRELFDVCGLSGRCSFLGKLAAELDLLPESYDLITSISVIEHIPGSGDLLAVEKMWQLLKPGGRLLISVPCSAQAFEEYVDYDEYRLQDVDCENFVFGQRFYNDKLLRERIFSVTGLPKRVGVYGEKRPGYSFANREAKVNDPNYPFWMEPYLTGQHFTYFSAIDALPGLGVVSMIFEKAC
jgi:SAM-dependent methyltransferase